MKNFLSILWVVLISILFFVGTSLLTKKEVVYENDEVKWKQLNKEELVIAAQHYYYFVIENSSKNYLQAYKINSQHASYKASELHVFNVPKNTYTDDELFEKLRKAEIDSMQILFMDYNQLKDLVSNAENIKARELEQKLPTYGMIEFIEETALIFLILAAILLVALLFYRFTLKRFIKSKQVTLVVECTLMLVIIFLLYKGTTPDWYATHKITALFQLGFTFFGAYIVLSKFKNKPWFQDLPVYKQLLTRFFITLITVSFFVFMGIEIARSLDLTLLEGSSYTGLAIRKRLPLGLGVAFAYTLADLLYHFIKAIRIKNYKHVE